MVLRPNLNVKPTLPPTYGVESTPPEIFSDAFIEMFPVKWKDVERSVDQVNSDQSVTSVESAADADQENMP